MNIRFFLVFLGYVQNTVFGNPWQADALSKQAPSVKERQIKARKHGST